MIFSKKPYYEDCDSPYDFIETYNENTLELEKRIRRVNRKANWSIGLQIIFYVLVYGGFASELQVIKKKFETGDRK